MCFHCDNIGRKATDEEIERQEDEVETMIKIIVPGEPIAKARPKFARRGKFVQTYNIQETEEGKFIAQVLAQANGKTIDGPTATIATSPAQKHRDRAKPSPLPYQTGYNYINVIVLTRFLFRDDVIAP